MTGLGRRAFLGASGLTIATAAAGLGSTAANAAASAAGFRSAAPHAAAAGARAVHRAPRNSGRRKLIEAGWDMPGAVFVRDNIAAMQATQFDGVVFNLMENPGTKYVQAFDVFGPQQVLTLADMKLDVLQDIEWGSFTDNFIYAYAYAQAAGGVDWFDDAIWNNTAAKIALLGQALAASGAKGIALDPEDYGAHTWLYSTSQFPGKTFQQVKDQVRLRGAQFMTALQTAKPDVVVLCYFLGVMLRYQSENYEGHEYDSPYATFPAFIAGMLSTIGESVTIVDGSEDDYYLDETTQFFRSRQYQEGGWYLMPTAEQDAFGRIEMGSTVYVDNVLGHARAGIASKYPYYSSLTATDVQRWYEHNVYHAMLKSDRYVWVYSEAMTWWNPTAPYAGAYDGMVNAKAKFNAGDGLGFDLCRYSGFLDMSTKPVAVLSPQLSLSGPAHGSVVQAGDVVVLTASLGAADDVHAYTFYDNGREIETSMYAPYRAAVSVSEGAHTFVARAFRADTTHVTSNLLTVIAG
ncbi:Ig-like domain-containing protein [Plantibacter sp. YIM 135249]|uniref:Ig-like domain-containing protein n=1 Tax=Plantibacter sp. YIM 135249 TaxID=3423918 RepID=UPI003D329192